MDTERVIYTDSLRHIPATSTEEQFKSSRKLFENFRKRIGIHSARRYCEAASSDDKSAEKFVKTVAELIEAKMYITQQVLYSDETELLWKKMPSKTDITTEEKKMPGHKPMKDRLILAVCANASGNCMVKLLFVYHSENLRAFNAYTFLKVKL